MSLKDFLRDPDIRQAWRLGWEAMRDDTGDGYSPDKSRARLYKESFLRLADMYSAQDDAKKEIIILFLAHPALLKMTPKENEETFGTAVASLYAELEVLFDEDREQSEPANVSPLAQEAIDASSGKLNDMLSDLLVSTRQMNETLEGSIKRMEAVEHEIRDFRYLLQLKHFVPEPGAFPN